MNPHQVPCEQQQQKVDSTLFKLNNFPKTLIIIIIIVLALANPRII
jgi:hypothetical protein